MQIDLTDEQVRILHTLAKAVMFRDSKDLVNLDLHKLQDLESKLRGYLDVSISGSQAEPYQPGSEAR